VKTSKSLFPWATSHFYAPTTYFPMSVIPKYFSCYHIISLCFEILLTWYLVCGCIMISYRSCLRFVPVQWFFGRVVTLGLWNLAKYLVVTTFCRGETTKYLAKFQSPRAIARPKIIGPEWNLLCNWSLYTHIPKIKSMSPSSFEIWPHI
jgi:hypothetical protein